MGTGKNDSKENAGKASGVMYHTMKPCGSGKGNLFVIKYMIGILILIFLFPNCENNRDSYYTKKSDWRAYKRRIPLIKPYDAQCPQKIWNIAFFRPCKSCPDGGTFCICATKINVIDSIIIVYCDQEWPIQDKTVDSLWSFIIPSKKVEVTFNDRKSFEDSLSYYTKKPPVYRDVEDVWQQYKNNGWLDWFPEEYKK